MSDWPTAPKVCFLCNQDCSDRARVKDQHGRYICRACVEARERAKAAHTLATASTDVLPPEDAPAAPAPASDDAYDLAPDTSPPDRLRLCPSCGHAMGVGSIKCHFCGYDERVGLQAPAPDPHAPAGAIAKPDSSAAVKCSGCGYDMTGLKSPRCPECGKIRLKQSRREQLEEHSRRTARDAWLKPVIMIAVGLTGIAIWQLIADRSGRDLMLSMVGFGLKIPIGLFVYYTCAVIWIGFDMPFRLIILRLIAVYALTSLIAIPVGHLPTIVIPAAIMFIVYTGLLADMLDLDFQDASFVALGTVLANVMIVAFVLAML